MKTKFNIGDIVYCVYGFMKDANQKVQKIEEFKVKKITIYGDKIITYVGEINSENVEYREEFLAKTPEELKNKYLQNLNKEMRERKNHITRLIDGYSITSNLFPYESCPSDLIGKYNFIKKL